MRKPRTPEQRAAAAAYMRQWRKANPEKSTQNSRRWNERHPEKRTELNRASRERLGPEYWQQHHFSMKVATIRAYGGVCVCCGESELAFLSIDHVNGGGSAERKKLGATGVYRKLREAGYPKGEYQVLCMNCQFGTRFGRTCPHQGWDPERRAAVATLIGPQE